MINRLKVKWYGLTCKQRNILMGALGGLIGALVALL
jgi:hypothetical protein